jgi:hypothetical protein
MLGLVIAIRMPKIWNVSAKLLSFVMLASIDQICFTARLLVGINISEE